MAQKATVYKAELQIANINEGYYHTHNLTIACHPSETTERMMLRILAFALNANDNLAFTKGISTDDEPDLWQIEDNGDISLWIELGTPDERRIRKACGRSSKVTADARLNPETCSPVTGESPHLRIDLVNGFFICDIVDSSGVEFEQRSI